MPKELGEHIAEILDWLDQGLFTQDELMAHVGLALVERGTTADIAELPPWLHGRLVNWAREFQKSDSWLLVSNAGEQDVSNEGRKLLALIKDAGLLS